ncbi:MAG: type II secretion system GspH family protein [Akkermansiaceae bacterium]|nr:type II secretion system GspH family protein [Akkermansiaceae bacterium]
MKTNHTTRRGFTLVELLVVITIIAALAALVSPQVMRALKKADANTAVSNARQIGLAMFSFQNEYGTFPDADTQTDVEDDFPDGDITLDATSSNGYFRQLFRGEFTDSEEIFFAKTAVSKKPDGVITGTNCLETKENAFGYIMNQDEGLTTGGNSARTIAATPLTEAGLFDQDAFDKKAVSLRIDQSVQILNINADGEALLKGGASVLTAGNDTVWGSDITPTMKEPN